MRRSKSQQSDCLPVSRSNSVASFDDRAPKRKWFRTVILFLGLAAGIFTVANLLRHSHARRAKAHSHWDPHELQRGYEHGWEEEHAWDEHPWDSHHHTAPQEQQQQHQGGTQHAADDEQWLGRADWEGDGEWHNAYDDQLHAGGHHGGDGWDAYAGEAGGQGEGLQHDDPYGHADQGTEQHYEHHDEHWDPTLHEKHHDEHWPEQHPDLHAQLEQQAQQQQAGQPEGGAAGEVEQYVPDPLADETHHNTPHAPVPDADPHSFQSGGLYSMSAVDADGHVRDLAEGSGMVTMVVNVASQCGFTDENYKGLKEVYDKYSAHGFQILAFPCNQFGNQEPGTDAEIKRFCEQTYHVHWMTFSKIDVNGPSAHPVYQFLRRHLPLSQGGGGGSGPGQDLRWNFQKILVDRNGFPVKLHTQGFDRAAIEHDIYNLLVGNPLNT